MNPSDICNMSRNLLRKKTIITFGSIVMNERYSKSFFKIRLLGIFSDEMRGRVRCERPN